MSPAGCTAIQAAAVREEAAAATRAERRARLEEAIARCERGDVAGGLERMRALGPDDTLPVKEGIAAWGTRVPARTPVPPAVRASHFAIAPSGQFAATAEDNAVRIWSLPDWKPVGDPWPADGPVTAMAWEDGGTRLAIGTTNGTVHIGDGAHAPFQPTTAVGPGGTPVSGLWVTPSEVRVALGTMVRAYEEDEEPTTEELPGTAPGATLVPGPNGSLAAVTADGAVKVFDPHGRRWLDLPPDGDAAAVAHAADGNVIAVGTRGGTVRLWDVVSRTPLTGAVPLGGPVTSVAVGSSATTYTVLARANEPAMLTCPRPFVAAPLRLPADPGRDVLGVAFAPDGLGLFVTSPAGVSVWRLWPGGRFVRATDIAAAARFPTGGKVAACCVRGAHDANPAALLVGGSGGRVFLVDADRGGELAAAVVTGADEITTMTAGPHGRVFASGRAKDRRGLVGFWDGSGMGPSPGHVHRLDADVLHGEFLPDGSAVVLGCEDGTVHVFDPVTGQDVRPPLACGSPVLGVAVGEEGSRILAGCADGTAHLWDRASGTELQVVRHRAAVRAVAFHGNDLLTASADGTARRWHAGTGLPIGPPLTHADAITALSARGTLVATGGRDRVVRVWRLP